MWKRKKGPKVADNPIVICDKAHDLIAKYESTQDPSLLEEMKAIKPQLQEAIKNSFSNFSNVPKEMAMLKSVPALAYNKLGGLSLYLKEYSEAWDYYEKCRQLALEAGFTREIVQATNNLGNVALIQGDFDIALEQFELAASYCSDLSSDDKWMLEHIEQNIERAKSKLGKW